MASNSTYVSKVFIQQLNISVQHLEGKQLIILVLQTSTEVQAGIPAVEEEKSLLW